MKKKGLSYQDQAGFKIPKDYFRSFEERMMEKISSDERWEKSPQHPFKVPEDYFDGLEEKVMRRISEEEKEVKVISLFRRKAISRIAGVAAVLVIVCTSVVFQNSRKATFEDLDMLAVENYILESLEFANPNETPFLQEGEVGFADSSNPQIEREALLEYLKENIEEPALLLNEE